MSSRHWDFTDPRAPEPTRAAMLVPMYTYETEMYGQTVTVKRYPPGPKPKTYDAAPRQARTLYRVTPEHKDQQQGTADKWLPAEEKAEGDKNETDYAAIRELPPIDGRREHWRVDDYLGRAARPPETKG